MQYIAAGAQVQAKFSADKTGGCSPLLVGFTNQTTGAGNAASYMWDLGNGNFSTERNPSAVYTEAKTYTVKLTVTDGALVSSTTQTLTVYKKPEASIRADVVKGCAPLLVSLSADATAGDGSIRSWFWDFGDGETQSSTGATVSHTYNFSQPASVSVTLENSFGCRATVVADSLVNVLPKISANFSAPQTTLCRITDPVTFTNKSTGPGTLNYTWSFGDGTTSTEASPTHVYSSKNLYDVSLTVKSPEGCIATKKASSYINANSFHSEIIAPGLYCTGKEIKFMNSSTPGPDATVWDVEGYGTGWTYQGPGTAIYYLYTTGPNRVRMINTFGNCKDTVIKTFEIFKSPEVHGFVAEKSTDCGGPATVNFRDTTAGAVAWKWNYNCWDCTTADATIQNTSKYFSTAGLQYVKLAVTNAAGCTSEVADVVDLSPPQMIIDVVGSSSYSSMWGCEGLTISFKASRPDTIASYKWTFNDDNSTSTDAIATHVFKHAGTFQVRLDYVLKNGCTGTCYYNDVHVRAKPKFTFVSQSGTDICGNTPVRFYGSANESLNWSVNFGDGDTRWFWGSPLSYDRKYEKEGVYTITVAASAEGCYDTLVLKDYIKVSPPFPEINGYQNTCVGTRGDVVFTDASRQAESWRWDFGDGTSSSYTTPPAEIKHTYTKTGDYNTVLTTTNGGCTVKDSVMTHVYLKQHPVLSAPATVTCADQWFQISITGMENNTQAYYYWAQYNSLRFQYKNGTDAALWPYSLTGYEPGPDMKFNLMYFERGAQEFRVVMRSDPYNCYDTTNYIPVNVKGPVAGFTFEPEYCSGNAIRFIDTSKATGGVPIETYTWSFGDGTMGIYNSPEAFVHQYPYASSFDINYTVTDADGCKDTKYVPYLRAGGVKADFTASATTIAPNSQVSFTNITYDNYTNSCSYQWIFGDGSTSAEINPSHIYTQPGTYTVMLLATSSVYGCTDTARQTITVKYVNSAFSFAGSFLQNSHCPPVLVRFTNKSMNAYRLRWDFGDGSRAEDTWDPSHVYTRPGKYLVTLYVYSYNGTGYTTTDSVFIGAATNASVFADRVMACTSGTVQLNANAPSAVSYAWDFGDGTVVQTSDSFATHHFASAGLYSASVVVTDAEGCSAASRMEQAIVIDSLRIDIGEVLSACNSVEMPFNPMINSVAGGSGRQALRYSWDFGTGMAGDTSDLRNPLFSYKSPGSYTVRFSVVSEAGCSKQTSKTVKVDERIHGQITGPDDLCAGEQASFLATASAPVSWGWDFGQGGSSLAANPPPQLFAQAGSFRVALTATNGACVDTTYHLLEVHAFPQINMPQHELLLCAGSTIQLSANGGDTYQWRPAAGLDDASDSSPVASPGSSTTYTVEAQSRFGCKYTDSVHITVAPPMHLSVSADALICEGEQVQLTASGADRYQWVNTTAGLSNTSLSNPVASPQVTTVYSVRGTDAYDCFVDTANVKVTVAPLPSVNAGADVMLVGGNPYTFQPAYSADVVQWQWWPATNLSCSNCASPVVMPIGDEVYTVTVKNGYGCMAADTIKITTECGESHIYIPSAFSPNGDDKNPRFNIRGGGVKMVVHLAIFNRWGEKVFERDHFEIGDASASWDGRFRGLPVPGGVYVYLASFECASGEVFTKKGTVAVVY